MTFSVLMYHEIRKERDFNPAHTYQINVKQDYQDVLPAPLFVMLQHFEDQMKWLHDQQFHTLTLNEVKAFYQGEPVPQKSILLTFDDCFQSIKEYAYPILKKYGFQAVMFVVTGWLHENPKPFESNYSICLTEKDLFEMQDVFTYANHTHHFHQRENLTTSKIMAATDEKFSQDLQQCNQYEVITEKDVFAYPFGLFTERNVALLEENGFQLAFTCENGHNNQNTNPLLLKRNAVPYFLTLEEFQKLIVIGEK